MSALNNKGIYFECLVDYVRVQKYLCSIAEKLSRLGERVIWPLYHTLTYPVYGEFNHQVYTKFKESILEGKYDIVHAMTPMMPRYPVEAIKACTSTPFILGPVNGGVPFPKGFQKVARQEFSDFNFLRSIGRFIIPGYRETYTKADYILAGSTYTLNLVKELFDIKNEKIELFYENGIGSSFLKNEASVAERTTIGSSVINLLFVGRLVPYKGADILIDAISRVKPSIRNNLRLTIVGDGSERKALEQLVEKHKLTAIIAFTGWVDQKDTLQYYSNSNIFCFPSIREFGGAVVLEAMANGLPCIVVNNGGIGEYVTEETGFRINPESREFVVRELTVCIEKLVTNPLLRKTMSIKAIQRVKEFTWSAKAEAIVRIYNKQLIHRV